MGGIALVVNQILVLGGAISKAVAWFTALFAAGTFGETILIALMLAWDKIVLALTVGWGIIQGIAVGIGGVLASITAPVWLLIGALVALVALVVLNWDILKENFIYFWDEAKEAFNNFISQYVESWNRLVQLIGDFVTAISDWIVGAWETIKDSFISLVEKLLWLRENWAFVLGSILGTVVAVIVGIISFFVSLPAKIGEAIGEALIVITNWIDTTKQRFKEWKESVSTTFKNWVEEAILAVKDFGKRMLEGIIEMVNTSISRFKQWWTDLKSWFRGLPSQMKQLIKDIGRAMSDGWNQALNWVTTSVSNWWGNVRSKFSEIKNNIQDWARETIGAISSAVTSAPGAMIDAVKRFYNSKVADTINRFIEGFNKTSPIDIGFRVPYLEKGGVVKGSSQGTLAVIGENNKDEAVVPLDNMGGIGGLTLNLNVSGDLIMDENSKDNFAREMVTRFTREMQRLGYSPEQYFNNNFS